MKRNIYISVILIIAAGFIVYSNSLGGKFIWGDHYLVRDNMYLRNPSRIPEIFSRGLGTGAGIGSTSYRPLQTLTYILNYSLAGLDVRMYHFTNVLFHVLTALCVYWLVRIISGSAAVSLFAGLLFVTHPIHTGAVAYISGRADPMAGLFMLLSFILYIKRLNSNSAILFFSWFFPTSWLFFPAKIA